MSHIVILTFDIENPTKNIHGDILSYREILNQVKELDFYKSKKGQMLYPFELPDNTHLIKFEENEPDRTVVPKLKAELKNIFENLKIKGKFFVFYGQNYGWGSGPIEWIAGRPSMAYKFRRL
ncbi:hypothetical protein GN109_05235 [Collimonas pratensis]|uniref:hypothetical protein n=1 Tax=Collimonas pratensis TaxID=279113 RepID=UPI00143D76EB|nr:hypothetical protein [Collimonas pratensis]NKI68817.1 hypothetical protein [Collimonas pratensis]